MINSTPDYNTIRLVAYDCSTIYTIATKFNEPIFNMMIVSYLALFCCEAENCFNIKLLNGKYVQDITDIRNAIKIYGERFAKSSKKFLSADFSQDTTFKNQLRFSFMRNWNIHYNLGIYCDKNGKIIGNTQLIEDTLALRGLTTKQRKTKSFEMGQEIGSIIGKLFGVLYIENLTSTITTCNNTPKLYSIDTNTNRKHNIFRTPYKKDINLNILNMLSTIGFVNNYISSLLPKDNLWLFRIRYIVTYYSLLGIEKIRNHLVNNYDKEDILVQKSEKYISMRSSLFKSDFRNCMMHYNLYKDGKCAIKQEFLDSKKPFLGLVESCYNGKSFETLNLEVTEFSKKLELLLQEHIFIKKENLKEI